MTYDEFQRHVGKAGLSLKEFAGLLRMNRASLSNLAKKEEVPAHLAIIATLLGEMAEQRVDFRPALSRIDIRPKKPRGTSLAAWRRSSRGQSDREADRNERRKGLAATLEQSKNKHDD